MADETTVLDGLAWAGITEEARVARLAAMLVRQASAPNHTQSHIKDTIRGTAPPYGRAKYIFEKLYGDKTTPGEIERQFEIYIARKRAHDDFEAYLEHMSTRSTRLNKAYASRFDRPMYEPKRACPTPWDWTMEHDHPHRDLQTAWNNREAERDKGDTCLAITHQDGYTVALVEKVNMTEQHHIAVRLRKGPIVRTSLREECHNLVEAAVSLGGPRVRAALAKGKRVKTDWVGRRSFIYHDGSDHEEPKVEEVSWLAREYTFKVNKHPWGVTHDREHHKVIVHGEHVEKDHREDEEDDYWSGNYTSRSIFLGD